MGEEGGKAGYKYLLAFKVTVPVYDYTVVFCDRYLLPHAQNVRSYTRTHDQMVQSARSGMQNIAEGNKQQSLKGYIQLAGVARGSLEELLNDYHSYARQQQLSIWDKGRADREIEEIREIWRILKSNPVLPDNPYFPNLPDDPEKTVNLMITLIHQANYLLDKLILSLKDRHMKRGGLSEELYRKRTEYKRGKL